MKSMIKMISNHAISMELAQIQNVDRQLQQMKFSNFLKNIVVCFDEECVRRLCLSAMLTQAIIIWTLFPENKKFFVRGLVLTSKSQSMNLMKMMMSPFRYQLNGPLDVTSFSSLSSSSPLIEARIASSKQKRLLCPCVGVTFFLQIYEFVDPGLFSLQFC